ncbi:MAG TPA: FtsQ-type POTRA domain-containing protein [Verrucomicrobiae bacterium]|nr:FtsQ-type POTRA domain-containing protein [Verrucomicrobiae bacterium]
MWFKRKKGNRRLGRGHVLDVKLRSDRVRANRSRLATVAISVVFGTVFGLYLFWRAGEWALDRFIYDNSDFAIQKIDVQTDGVISTDQLRRWSGVKLGANLFALDLASIKRNLELVPTIDSVSVERVMPQTLKIRVTERQPIAQVNVSCAGPNGAIVVSVFQLDANGYVMQPLDRRLSSVPLAQMRDQLPVITGLNVFQLQPGRRLDLPQAQAALKLVSAFNRSSMAGLADLRRIDVAAPGVVVAVTAEGSEITFGLDNFDRQLARWRTIYDLGQRMNRSIATADLAVDNNVPVRWAAINVIPAPTRNSPPQNSRRNNV